jgi:hypothetical protein
VEAQAGNADGRVLDSLVGQPATVFRSLVVVQDLREREAVVLLSPAATMPRAPCSESGPMITIGRASTRTFPVRTYLSMIVGMIWVSKTWHDEHCRSMYSSIFTGADGEPRNMPLCGIPRRSETAVPVSGAASGCSPS